MNLNYNTEIIYGYMISPTHKKIKNHIWLSVEGEYVDIATEYSMYSYKHKHSIGNKKLFGDYILCDILIDELKDYTFLYDQSCELKDIKDDIKEWSKSVNSLPNFFADCNIKMYRLLMTMIYGQSSMEPVDTFYTQCYN